MKIVRRISAIPLPSLEQLEEQVRRSPGDFSILHLSNRNLESIPYWVIKLVNLVELHISDNSISVIPDFLSYLTRLRYLDLRNNRIAGISESLSQLTGLEVLHLTGNPLPEDVIAASLRGARSVFRYLGASKTSHPRTVKLVLLGEPKSGKTTLVEAFKGDRHPCDEYRRETVGVNVAIISKEHPSDKNPIYLSTWDFAGQHIEHATHQFFLSENAIYLILWNARLGAESGRRDIWYWLELLRMRVREPKYLLVATHTALTPADLSWSEIENLYPGYQGHFSIDLSDLSGLSSLEAKIVEMAAESPSLKAKWPASWLSVKNKIRHIRQRKTHLSPAEFRTLMKKFNVSEREEQNELAAQLHSLGEILYFQEREELSRLVILNPDWVTELVGLVVRSRRARENRGVLRRADLRKLWNEAHLARRTRQHLIRLMDWFDLTYSTGDPNEPGIVVEALPFSTPGERKEVRLPENKPTMEMIYKFSSLQRHLPPGIPTWSIARAHRFSSRTPWRDLALFQDTDSQTESYALITASDSMKEVRLKVAADYPPFFFGRLDAILRDTFRRYPGLDPERRLPCSCQPDCPSSFLFETVVKRRNEGKQSVSCDNSGKDVPIESLFGSAYRTDSEQGYLALQSDIRRLATQLLQIHRETMENTCPSVFTLLPCGNLKQLDTWIESATHEAELELTLYCEHDSGWHATTSSVYRFRPEQEWVDLIKKYWNKLLNVTKYVGPLAKSLGKASGFMCPEIIDVVEKLPEASRSEIGSLAYELGRAPEPQLIDIETRSILKKLIEHLDALRQPNEPRNGDLHSYLIDDGRLLWLCPKHRKSYQKRLERRTLLPY
jgi:internalin A